MDGALETMTMIKDDPKKSRKMMNTGMMAAFSGGIGLAIYIMQKIFGGMAPDANMNSLIDSTCLLLIAYTAVIVAVFILRRPLLLRVNFVLLYIVLPCVLLKLFGTYL